MNDFNYNSIYTVFYWVVNFVIMRYEYAVTQHYTAKYHSSQERDYFNDFQTSYLRSVQSKLIWSYVSVCNLYPIFLGAGSAHIGIFLSPFSPIFFYRRSSFDLEASCNPLNVPHTLWSFSPIARSRTWARLLCLHLRLAPRPRLLLLMPAGCVFFSR